MPDEYGDFRDVPARIRDAKVRDDQGAELEGLLLWCLAQTEDEAELSSRGVAASYYYELAVLYRKRGDYAAEVRVLERYAGQPKSPGAMPAKLAERLVRARELAGLPPPPRPTPAARPETTRSEPSPVRRVVTVRPVPDPPPPVRQPGRPEAAPPRALARAQTAPASVPTRVKVAAGVVAALVVFSLPSLFGGGTDSTSSGDATSGDATGSDATSGGAAPADAVTFFEAERDSLLAGYALLAAEGRYAEAEAAVDSAYAVVAADDTPTPGDVDTLTAIRDAVIEARLLADARAVPGSDLDGNRQAYAALAARYPAEQEYARKRDEYAGRIEAERLAEVRRAERRAARAAYVPRGSGGYSSGARTSGCCKQCSAGQPCGNSCISRAYACHQPPGCAC